MTYWCSSPRVHHDYHSLGLRHRKLFPCIRLEICSRLLPLRVTVTCTRLNVLALARGTLTLLPLPLIIHYYTLISEIPLSSTVVNGKPRTFIIDGFIHFCLKIRILVVQSNKSKNAIDNQPSMTAKYIVNT